MIRDTFVTDKRPLVFDDATDFSPSARLAYALSRFQGVGCDTDPAEILRTSDMLIFPEEITKVLSAIRRSVKRPLEHLLQQEHSRQPALSVSNETTVDDVVSSLQTPETDINASSSSDDASSDEELGLSTEGDTDSQSQTTFTTDSSTQGVNRVSHNASAADQALFSKQQVTIVLDLSRSAFDVARNGQVFVDRMQPVIDLILSTVKETIQERTSRHASAKRSLESKKLSQEDALLTSSLLRRVWNPTITVSLFLANVPISSSSRGPVPQWRHQSGTAHAPRSVRNPLDPSLWSPRADGTNENGMLSGIVPVFVERPASEVCNDDNLRDYIASILQQEELAFQSIKLRASDASGPDGRDKRSRARSHASPGPECTAWGRGGLAHLTQQIIGLLPTRSSTSHTVVIISHFTPTGANEDICLLHPALMTRGVTLGLVSLSTNVVWSLPHLAPIASLLSASGGFGLPYSFVSERRNDNRHWLRRLDSLSCLARMMFLRKSRGVPVVMPFREGYSFLPDASKTLKIGTKTSKVISNHKVSDTCLPVTGLAAARLSEGWSAIVEMDEDAPKRCSAKYDCFLHRGELSFYYEAVATYAGSVVSVDAQLVAHGSAHVIDDINKILSLGPAQRGELELRGGRKQTIGAILRQHTDFFDADKDMTRAFDGFTALSSNRSDNESLTKDIYRHSNGGGCSLPWLHRFCVVSLVISTTLPGDELCTPAAVLQIVNEAFSRSPHDYRIITNANSRKDKQKSDHNNVVVIARDQTGDYQSACVPALAIIQPFVVPILVGETCDMRQSTFLVEFRFSFSFVSIRNQAPMLRDIRRMIQEACPTTWAMDSTFPLQLLQCMHNSPLGILTITDNSDGNSSSATLGSRRGAIPLGGQNTEGARAPPLCTFFNLNTLASLSGAAIQWKTVTSFPKDVFQRAWNMLVQRRLAIGYSLAQSAAGVAGDRTIAWAVLVLKKDDLIQHVDCLYAAAADHLATLVVTRCWPAFDEAAHAVSHTWQLIDYQKDHFILSALQSFTAIAERSKQPMLAPMPAPMPAAMFQMLSQPRAALRHGGTLHPMYSLAGLFMWLQDRSSISTISIQVPAVIREEAFHHMIHIVGNLDPKRLDFSTDVEKCEKTVVPILKRCGLENTNTISFFGHGDNTGSVFAIFIPGGYRDESFLEFGIAHLDLNTISASLRNHFGDAQDELPPSADKIPPPDQTPCDVIRAAYTCLEAWLFQCAALQDGSAISTADLKEVFKPLTEYTTAEDVDVTFLINIWKLCGSAYSAPAALEVALRNIDAVVHRVTDGHDTFYFAKACVGPEPVSNSSLDEPLSPTGSSSSMCESGEPYRPCALLDATYIPMLIQIALAPTDVSETASLKIGIKSLPSSLFEITSHKFEAPPGLLSEFAGAILNPPELQQRDHNASYDSEPDILTRLFPREEPGNKLPSTVHDVIAGIKKTLRLATSEAALCALHTFVSESGLDLTSPSVQSVLPSVKQVLLEPGDAFLVYSGNCPGMDDLTDGSDRLLDDVIKVDRLPIVPVGSRRYCHVRPVGEGRVLWVLIGFEDLSTIEVHARVTVPNKGETYPIGAAEAPVVAELRVGLEEAVERIHLTKSLLDLRAKGAAGADETFIPKGWATQFPDRFSTPVNDKVPKIPGVKVLEIPVHSQLQPRRLLNQILCSRHLEAFSVCKVVDRHGCFLVGDEHTADIWHYVRLILVPNGTNLRPDEPPPQLADDAPDTTYTLQVHLYHSTKQYRVHGVLSTIEHCYKRFASSELKRSLSSESKRREPSDEDLLLLRAAVVAERQFLVSTFQMDRAASEVTLMANLRVGNFLPLSGGFHYDASANTSRGIFTFLSQSDPLDSLLVTATAFVDWQTAILVLQLHGSWLAVLREDMEKVKRAEEIWADAISNTAIEIQVCQLCKAPDHRLENADPVITTLFAHCERLHGPCSALRYRNISQKRISVAFLVPLLEAVSGVIAEFKPVLLERSSDGMPLVWRNISWRRQERTQQAVEEPTFFLVSGLPLYDGSELLPPVHVVPVKNQTDVHMPRRDALTGALTVVQLSPTGLTALSLNLRDADLFFSGIEQVYQSVVSKAGTLSTVMQQMLGIHVPRRQGVTQFSLAQRCCGDTSTVDTGGLTSIQSHVALRKMTRYRSASNADPRSQHKSTTSSNHLEMVHIVHSGLTNRGVIVNNCFPRDAAVKVLHDDCPLALIEAVAASPGRPLLEMCSSCINQLCECKIILKNLDAQHATLFRDIGSQTHHAFSCAPEERELLVFSHPSAVSHLHDAFIGQHYHRHLNYAHMLVEKQHNHHQMREAMRALQSRWPNRSDPKAALHIVADLVRLQSISRFYYGSRVPDFMLRSDAVMITPEVAATYSTKRVVTSHLGEQICQPVQQNLAHVITHIHECYPDMHVIEVDPKIFPPDSDLDPVLEDRLANRCGLVQTATSAEPITFKPKLVYCMLPIHCMLGDSSAMDTSTIAGGLFVLEIGFNFVNYALDMYIAADETIPQERYYEAATRFKQRLWFSSVLYDRIVGQAYDSAANRAAILPGQQLLADALKNILQYYPSPPSYSTNALQAFDVTDTASPILKRSSGSGVRSVGTAQTSVLLVVPPPHADNRESSLRYRTAGLIIWDPTGAGGSAAKATLFVMVVSTSSPWRAAMDEAHHLLVKQIADVDQQAIVEKLWSQFFYFKDDIEMGELLDESPKRSNETTLRSEALHSMVSIPADDIRTLRDFVSRVKVPSSDALVNSIKSLEIMKEHAELWEVRYQDRFLNVTFPEALILSLLNSPASQHLHHRDVVRHVALVADAVYDVTFAPKGKSGSGDAPAFIVVVKVALRAPTESGLLSISIWRESFRAHAAASSELTDTEVDFLEVVHSYFAAVFASILH